MAAGYGQAMTDISFNSALAVWWRLGILSFGGPAAQIALMHRILVDERRWLSEQDFLRALSFCMLLPGPEAMQLATYAGWRLHGVRGGLAAGLLFVLPGAVVVMALAAVYVRFGDVALLQAAFIGIKAAVLVIVIEALLRVAKKGLADRLHWLVAALAFIALFFLALPFPIVVLVAGILGFTFGTAEPQGALNDVVVSAANTIRTIIVWLAIWLVPLALLAWGTSIELFAELALFFSKLAMVTFGGAYAVLAYMAQDAVQLQGWLTTEEMMDGLGLAETTPGPLILVTEFVGFLAGARAVEPVSVGMGVVGALVALWATFAPCFLWVFAGAPYIERLSTQPRLRAALAAISAAVVGVILNLSIWFAIHVFFSVVGRVEFGPLVFLWPQWASLDLAAVGFAALAALLLLFWQRSVVFTLAICCAIAAMTGSWLVT